MGGEKNEACVKECVNLIQQGSAVLYNWFLPVIREFELSSFRMTDKLQSQWWSHEGALRKAYAFLSHGVSRLYNHIKNCL
jgi:hypothetical protein